MFSRLRAELITPRARFALDNIVTRIHPAPQGARVYLYARQYGPPGAIRHFDYRALGLMSTLGVFWALIFASISITLDIFSVRFCFSVRFLSRVLGSTTSGGEVRGPVNWAAGLGPGTGVALTPGFAWGPLASSLGGACLRSRFRFVCHQRVSLVITFFQWMMNPKF